MSPSDQPQTLTTRQRGAALAGTAAVGCFIGAWAIQGARRTGYSPIDDAISQLAAVGAPGRSGMTAGFVAFGLGMPVYASALRRTVDGPAWKFAVANGLATLGVAAVPLGRADGAHYVFAIAGYAALAAMPISAARPLAVVSSTWSRASMAAGITSALVLAASAVDAGHGLTQRLGLGIGDAWIVATSLTMWRRGRLVR